MIVSLRTILVPTLISPGQLEIPEVMLENLRPGIDTLFAAGIWPRVRGLTQMLDEETKETATRLLDAWVADNDALSAWADVVLTQRTESGGIGGDCGLGDAVTHAMSCARDLFKLEHIEPDADKQAECEEICARSLAVLRGAALREQNMTLINRIYKGC